MRKDQKKGGSGAPKPRRGSAEIPASQTSEAGICLLETDKPTPAARAKRAASSPMEAFQQGLEEVAAESRRRRAKLPEEPGMILQALALVEELDAMLKKIRAKFDDLDSLVSGVYARAEYDRDELIDGLQSVIWGACGAERTYAAVEVMEAMLRTAEDALEARAGVLDPGYVQRVYREFPKL